MQKSNLILFILSTWIGMNSASLPQPQAMTEAQRIGGQVANGVFGTINEVMDENKDLIRRRLAARMTGREFIPPPNPYLHADNQAGYYRNGGYPQVAGYASNVYANPPMPQLHINPPINPPVNPPVNPSVNPANYVNPSANYPPVNCSMGYSTATPHNPISSATVYNPERLPCCSQSPNSSDSMFTPMQPMHHEGYFEYDCNGASQNDRNKVLLIGAALAIAGIIAF